LKPRSQAAVEQDQRQRDRSHQIGGAHVVEPQLARTGIAGQHADQEKHQEQGRAESQRQQARQNAGHHQKRAQKDGYADLVERRHEPLRKQQQILAIASLSPPQFDANRFLLRAAIARLFGANLPHRCVVAMAPEPRLWESGGYSNQVCSIIPAMRFDR